MQLTTVEGKKRKELRCPQSWCGPKLAKPGRRAIAVATTISRRERESKMCIRLSREHKKQARKIAREVDPIFNTYSRVSEAKANITNRKRLISRR